MYTHCKLLLVTPPYNANSEITIYIPTYVKRGINDMHSSNWFLIFLMIQSLVPHSESCDRAFPIKHKFL